MKITDKGDDVLALSNLSGEIFINQMDIDFLFQYLKSREAHRTELSNRVEFPHYFKELPAGCTHIDVYMVLDLFEVTDQTIGHAVKKLLCPGKRTGNKDAVQDITEAVKTLQRGLVIRGLKDGIDRTEGAQKAVLPLNDPSLSHE